MVRGSITRALLAFLLLALAPACATNRWGDICQTDGDCEDTELICRKANDDNLSGFCHYPDEVVCGPGTIMEQEGNSFVCVPDPESPPELVCGEGTTDQGGICTLD